MKTARVRVSWTDSVWNSLETCPPEEWGLAVPRTPIQAVVPYYGIRRLMVWDCLRTSILIILIILDQQHTTTMNGEDLATTCYDADSRIPFVGRRRFKWPHFIPPAPRKIPNHDHQRTSRTNTCVCLPCTTTAKSLVLPSNYATPHLGMMR